MTLKFELVQPGEYYEYFYNIVGDDNLKHGEIEFRGEWCVNHLLFCKKLNSSDYVVISNKLDEINAATKADKLFGFL